MSEPVNPYAPPPEFPIDAAGETAAPDRHPFVDAFTTGTRLFWRNLGLVVAVVFTVRTPIDLWVSYQEYNVLRPDDVGGLMRINNLSDLLVGVISHAAVLSIGAAAFQRQPLSYFDAMGTGLRQWARFVLGGALTWFAVILGLLLFIIPGIYVGVCLGYLYPVFVAEERPFWQSFRRCFAIAQRRFWISLAIMFFVGLLEGITGAFVAFCLGAAEELRLTEEIGEHFWIVDGLAWPPLNLVHAWGLLVVLAAYHRIRREEEAEEARRWYEGPAKPEETAAETQRQNRETMIWGE